MTEYNYEKYMRGREAFEDFLCDHSNDANADFFAGLVHSMVEFFEDVNISESIVRMLTDSGEGLTGHVM